MTKRVSTVRKMSEVERSLVGAYLDTDGYIAFNGKRMGRLGLGNTNLEIISALLRTTGVGKVCLIRAATDTWAPYWDWYVCPKVDIVNIASQVAAYSTKAQAFLTATEYRRGTEKEVTKHGYVQ